MAKGGRIELGTVELADKWSTSDLTLLQFHKSESRQQDPL